MTDRAATLVGVLAICVLVALPSATVAAPASSPATTSLRPTDRSGSTLPAALLAPWTARAGYDPTYASEVVGAVPVDGTIHLAVGLSPSTPALFLPPGPSTIRRASSLAGFEPSAASVAAVVQYFAGFGLRSTLAPDAFELEVSGPVTGVDRAFSTELVVGESGGRLVQYPAVPPSLPAPFETTVDYVVGLSTGFTTYGFSLAPAPLAAPSQGRTQTLITPGAARSLYGLDALYNSSGAPRYATGVTIAVVLWGDGYDPSDLTSFFSQDYPSQFPQVTVNPVPVAGAPMPSSSAVSDPSMAPQELTLDIEWAASEAPGATIYAVYAPDGPSSNQYSPSDASLESALSTAVGESGVQVLSMSFGTPDGADLSLQAAFAQTFSVAMQKGITILAASGDNGGTSKGNCGGGASPEFPAASPDVLAVGGTAPVESLNALGGITGFDSEPAWNGSGGGYSTVYADPSWQRVGSAAAQVESAGHRGIPDVAGPAYDDFFFFGAGARAGRGTSFATPMWAGLVGEMDATFGRSLGFLNERLYYVGAEEAAGTAGQGLVDITSGANCLTSATPGWDPVTGWGSPRALSLYQDLAGSFADVALAAINGPVAPGGSLTGTALVTNASTGAPVVGIAVNFTLTAVSYTGPCGGTLASASAITNNSGVASASLGVPACFLGSSALLTASVASGGYFGGNSTSIAVNLVGLAGFLAAIQTYPYNYVAFVILISVAIVLGYWIGERRRPRRRVAAVPPPPPPAGPTPFASAPPPPPPASSAAPAGADPLPPPPTIPPGAAGAAAAAPAPLPPTVGAIRVGCPACGTVPSVGATRCAACGAPLS